MDDSNPTQNPVFGKVIAKSWSDDGYKQQLLNDPRSALSEMGVDLPADLEITVSEQKPGELHLVLPPKPASGELSTESLQSISGGFCSCCCSSSAWGGNI